MLNIKKVGMMGLTIFASSAFLMNVNAAAHYQLSDFKANNNAIPNSCGALYDFSSSTLPPPVLEDEGICDFQNDFNEAYGQRTFEFTITGVDLDNDASFDIYMDDEKIATKTGAELAAGVALSYDKTKTYGTKELTVKT